MLIGLLILIFIRPFISSLAFPYLNSIYSFVLLGFLLIWVIIKGLSFKNIGPIRYPLILFILSIFISLIFSYDKITSIKELYKYISGVLLFLVGISLSGNDRNRLIRCILLAGLSISILAIYQYFFGFRNLSNYVAKLGISDASVLDYINRKRIFFPFVTPNILAGYLAMNITLALSNKNKTWFILSLSFALLLTKSLGALLSLFLALAVYFYLQGKLKKRNFLFLLGFLIFTGAIFMARSVNQKQHLQPVFSTMMRLNYWRDTLRIIKASPLIGVGLGNFNLPLSRYAHNSYLQLWAEMGILGLISFLWLIISVFSYGLKTMKNSPDKNQIAALITASGVFLIHNLVDFSFFLPEVNLIWWVITGCLFSFLFTN